MFKRSSLLKSLVVVLLMGVMMPTSVFAANDEITNSYVNKLQDIDFSKEPSKYEKEILNEYYKKDSERIFNESYGDYIYNRDMLNIRNELENKNTSLNYTKESNLNNLDMATFRSGSSLGTYGDILVTYSFSSFGIDVAATGHAAIVYNNSNYTVESFPDGGVRVYNNDWANKSKVYGVRVKGASGSDYTNAASYALTQANSQKPYNWNFFNKGTTDSFYCSQLVWRAWKNQGYEVDRMNLGDWEPVSPAELVGGDGTYVFYKD